MEQNNKELMVENAKKIIEEINTTKVITTKGMLYHSHIFEAFSYNGSTPRYVTTYIMSKMDEIMNKRYEEGVGNAIELGVNTVFGGVRPEMEQLRLPRRDGDLEKPFDPLFKNAYFMNASSQIFPEVVDKNLKRVYGEKKTPDGKYARLSVEFVPYNVNGNLGISCKLLNVQLLDGVYDLSERRSSAAEDFKTE